MSDAQGRDDTDGLDDVIAAWRVDPDSELTAPASDATIEAAERALGRPIPDELRRLYALSDGMSVVGGNLMIEPLTSGEGGLVGLGERLRAWGWPIPDEVLVFGGNGGSDQFGMWYPNGADPTAPAPIVMIGSVFEPGSMALAGTTLTRFLRAWSAYYLIAVEAPIEALEALGVPTSLRQPDEDMDLEPYFRWADPALPEVPDPYERGLDTAGIAAVIARLA